MSLSQFTLLLHPVARLSRVKSDWELIGVVYTEGFDHHFLR